MTGTPEPDHATEVARDPYALTCRDLARQTLHPESAKLADPSGSSLSPRDPALRKVVARETLNRTGRSVYYALTEKIRKTSELGFKPGCQAVESVRQGKYLAARNRPG